MPINQLPVTISGAFCCSLLLQACSPWVTMKLLLTLLLLPAFTMARAWPPRQPYQFQDIDYIYQPTLRDVQAEEQPYQDVDYIYQPTLRHVQAEEHPYQDIDYVYQPTLRHVQAEEMAGRFLGKPHSHTGTSTAGDLIKGATKVKDYVVASLYWIATGGK